MQNICIVYRYEGECKKEDENETNHLSELLKRIEERKRQRAAANNKSTLDVDGNNLEEPKKKKKKNLLKAEKTDESHIENASSEKIDEQTTEPVKVSKKKKKKKKDIESEHHSAADENIDLEEKDQNLAKKDNSDKNTTKKEIPSQNNFIVLGARSRKKQREVKRVLPDWLAHPEVVAADLNSGPALDELESILDIKLVEILKANGIVKLFPVQSSIIKWLHKCNMDRKLGWWLRDTCVSAPTGSGRYFTMIIIITMIITMIIIIMLDIIID